MKPDSESEANPNNNWLVWLQMGDDSSHWVCRNLIFGPFIDFPPVLLPMVIVSVLWSPMGDDSSRWVSRTQRWQSRRLLQLPSVEIVGKRSGFNQHPLSSRFRWLGFQMRRNGAVIASRLFCKVDPTLPSNFCFSQTWSTACKSYRRGRG